MGAKGLMQVSEPQEPKYKKIHGRILAGIIKGEWQPDHRIPGERELAKRFEASIGTVRHALQLLVNQGYLRRTQGRGTFVNRSVEHYDTLRYFRFASDFKNVVQPLTISCLEGPRLVAAPEEAKCLELSPEREVFRVRRTFFLGARPIVYVVTFLRPDLLPGFERISPRTIEELALYVLLEAKYGMPTTLAKERFSAQAAQDEEAEILGLVTGSPVLKIMLQAITTHDRPYAYQVAFCDTSAWQIYRD